MTQIDIQYLHQISPKLDRFKKKSQNLYNFRCPYCGDSKKKKSKARGFVYRVKNDMFYKCHNCGKGTTVGKLIEYVDPQSYKQWIVDKYKSGDTHSTKEPEFKFKPVKFDDKVLKGLISFDKLHDHPSYTYLTKRKIPKEHFSSLYFCPKFMTWVNTLIPNKFPNITKDYPRIVIPFFDINKKVFAFQGRAFGEEEPKYITIKLDENKKRIYGLDRLDVTKKIYVVEGPIDSLFLPNAIAVAGADLEIPKLKNQAVYIFDNEPRNKVVIDKVEKLILKNYNVCIWPKTIKEKDINELILSGYNSPEIQSLIDSNTFSKLSAIQQLNDYKEV